jgi:hypothetical protein
VEGIDLMSIHSDLGEIKKSLQATCTKTDLESAINCKNIFIKLKNFHTR